MYNPFSLENKTILVTGASSGIGRATAIECSKMGAKLIITGRNEERLKETLSKLEGHGHQYIIADLSLNIDINNLVNEIPSIDGIVNNAGLGKTKPINFINEDDLEDVFKTNTFSCFLLMKAILKNKKINRQGSIVFTSSIASFYSTPGNSVYAASKAAVTSYMKSCAVELANRKIRSNAVHPGMVETELIQGGALSENDKKKDMEQYPLKRYGKPEEVAYAIIYYLSDASCWVTGTSLIIDGGKLL